MQEDSTGPATFCMAHSVFGAGQLFEDDEADQFLGDVRIIKLAEVFEFVVEVFSRRGVRKVLAANFSALRRTAEVRPERIALVKPQVCHVAVAHVGGSANLE